MREVKDTGKYNIPAQFDYAGDEVKFDYTYKVCDSIDDAVDSIGEKSALATLNRMLKVDARNVASANAKSANGHSTRPVLTPEQKAENKRKRAEVSGLYAKIKTGDLTDEQKETLADLGISI